MLLVNAIQLTKVITSGQLIIPLVSTTEKIKLIANVCIGFAVFRDASRLPLCRLMAIASLLVELRYRYRVLQLTGVQR